MSCADKRERSIAHRLSAAALAVAQLSALMGLIGFSQGVRADPVQLSPNVTATAIGCATSNNGTGHVVCLEYSTGGGLVGVSWQPPPALNGGPGTEPPGTLHTLAPAFPNPAAPPVGAPGCGFTNDNTGIVSCLVVTKDSNGFYLSGYAFYPPPNPKTQVTNVQAHAQLGNGPIAAATATVSNPTCTGSIGNLVICALAVNQQLWGIAFDPRKPTATALTNLSLGPVVGAPNCASVPHTTIASVCAVRQQGGLLGFSFQYDANTAGIDMVSSVSLSTPALTSDPSCAAFTAPGPAAGQLTTSASCAITAGNNLVGVNFNPQTGAKNGPVSLGTAPDSGAWSASPGCSDAVDRQLGHLTSCAVVSSNANVFNVTFDLHVRNSIAGPYAANTNGSPSCVALAIDANQLYCGALTSGSSASGLELPEKRGPLNPAVMKSVQDILN